MTKTMKRGLWILLYIAMCFFAYQVLGWIGVLLIIGGGAIGALTLIPINRRI